MFMCDNCCFGKSWGGGGLAEVNKPPPSPRFTKKPIVTHKHQQQTPIQPSASATSSEAIDIDKMDLVLKQLNFDTQAFEVRMKKCSNVFKARAHQMHQWRGDRQQQLRQTSENYRLAFVELIVVDGLKAENVIGEVMEAERDFSKREGLQQPTTLDAICFLNHSVRTIIPATMKVIQTSAMLWKLGSSMQSIGVAMKPVFAYDKGGVREGQFFKNVNSKTKEGTKPCCNV